MQAMDLGIPMYFIKIIFINNTYNLVNRKIKLQKLENQWIFQNYYCYLFATC